MTKKMKIASVLLLAIAIVTGYYLWQIDRHEKALLGQEWLNPVPRQEWQAYLRNKETYEKTAEHYRANAPDVIAKAQHFRRLQHLTNALKGNNASTFLDKLDYDLKGIPEDFYVPPVSENSFKSSDPEMFKKWQDIIYDIRSKKYLTPQPTNPPKPIIKQSLDSLHRQLLAIDGILTLGLIVFLMAYKEPSEPLKKNKEVSQ